MLDSLQEQISQLQEENKNMWKQMQSHEQSIALLLQGIKTQQQTLTEQNNIATQHNQLTFTALLTLIPPSTDNQHIRNLLMANIAP